MFLGENIYYGTNVLFQISLKFVTMDPVHKSAIIQVTVWYCTSKASLHKQMATDIYDPIWRHYASIN